MLLKFKRKACRLAAPFVRLVRRRRPGQAARAIVEHAVKLAGREADPTPTTAAVVALVVPLWNTPRPYLDVLVASVRQQRPGTWQLILSDDGSTDADTRAWLDRHTRDGDLVIVRNAVNKGIVGATNAGIAVATAPWVGFLDHDDALVPHALDRIIKTLEANPRCQHLFTDEVVADDKMQPIDVFFKPAFDPVLLSGVNYLNHLSLYRRDRLLAIGGLRDGFEGSQDYDLALRYTAALRPDESLHLPYPAYIWRRDGASYSAQHLDRATDAARRALAEAYRRGDGVPAVVSKAFTSNLHRVRFDLDRTDWPLVSVIIPSRDALPLISTLLDGLLDHTDYSALEVIVIDNGSSDPRVLDLYRQREDGPVPFRVEIRSEPFNFSRAINRGVAMSRGSLILLLNNDIEIVEPHWLKEMVSCFAFPETAIVGAKLLYPNRTLQHAGVIAGLGGLAGHWFIGEPCDFPGPMGRLWVRQSLSVVTGACLLVSREAFDLIGPLDEERFAMAYNDVDFCLRAGALGRRVIWTPFATLIHRESATRGSDETAANAERFRREKANLAELHRTDRFEDRAFSPWYTKHLSFPTPISLDRLPPPR